MAGKGRLFPGQCAGRLAGRVGEAAVAEAAEDSHAEPCRKCDEEQPTDEDGPCSSGDQATPVLHHLRYPSLLGITLVYTVNCEGR